MIDICSEFNNRNIILDIIYWRLIFRKKQRLSSVVSQNLPLCNKNTYSKKMQFDFVYIHICIL